MLTSKNIMVNHIVKGFKRGPESTQGTWEQERDTHRVEEVWHTHLAYVLKAWRLVLGHGLQLMSPMSHTY